MGSFLVIGMGRFGSSIAINLCQMKHDVLVVEVDEDIASAVAPRVTDVIIGDVKDETVLRSLGVKNFDCVVVAIGDAIEDSVLTTIMLKEMGAKKLVCKAKNEWHTKILTQLGADKVICPESDMGRRVAHSLAQQNIIDYLEISPDYGIIEVITPMGWVGKSLAEHHLRRKHGITVIAVRRGVNNEVAFSPGGDMVLSESDVLTIIGLKKDLDKVCSLK